MSADPLAQLRFDERGLVPVVAQDVGSGEVLMLAWADREALEATLESGFAHYHSRSRGELWRKGGTSGHVQRVLAVVADCDGDAVLYRVEQTGPACHTGQRTCFHAPLPGTAAAAVGGEADAESASVQVAPGDGARANDGGPAARAARGAIETAVRALDEVVAERLRTLPEGSYVAKLHRRGTGYVAQKVVEEAGETVVAALQGQRAELRGEAADLLFHLGVLLAESGVSWDEVGETLLSRHRPTGEGSPT